MGHKLPQGWKEKQLNEIGHFIKGRGISKNDLLQHGIPCMLYGHIYTHEKEYIIELPAYINKVIAANSQEINYGDILFAGTGETAAEIGKCIAFIGTGKAYAGGDIIIFTGHTQHPLFLGYALNSQALNRQKAKFGQGNSIVHISMNSLAGMSFPLPPLQEQKKIARILSTWDEAIDCVQKLLANQQQQKKALMQQLLTGKKRLPGFKGKWDKVYIKDLFQRVITRNNGHSTNVVTISAQHGLIKQEEFFKKTVASDILDNYFLLKRGQFAYNKSYSQGYPMGVIKRLNRYDNAVVTTLYICFEVTDSKECDIDFFEYFFDSGILNLGLEKIAHEGGRAHGLLNVRPIDFFNLEMRIPQLPEQAAIANVLSKCDAIIAGYQAQLANLQNQKKALMQQLLTGKRRVKV